MIPVDWSATRLFLHVLAATVWVGGQLTLAALIPVLRSAGSDLPRLAARRFNRIGWPAYGVLIITGAWNVVAERDRLHGHFAATLAVKIAVVALSGVLAYWHTRVAGASRIALLGAFSGLFAITALFLGILLAG